MSASGRTDPTGRRICRWCPRTMCTVTYMSVKRGCRQELLMCPSCDSPDRPGVLEDAIDKWRIEFEH